MSETAARESMDMEESSQGSATSDQLLNKSEFIEDIFFQHSNCQIQTLLL